MKRYISIIKSITNKKLYFLLILLGSLCWMALEFVFALMIGNSYKTMIAGNFKSLVLSVTILFSAMQLLNVSQNVFDYLYSVITFKSLASLRQKLVKTVLQHNYKFVDKIDSGKIITLLNSDIDKIEVFYRMIVPNIVASILLFIGGLIWLTFVSWQLMIACLLISILGVVGNKILSRSLKTLSKKRQEQIEKLVLKVSSIVSGLLVLKSFNLEKKYSDSYANESYTLQNNNIKRVNVEAILGAFNQLISMIVILSVIILGSYLVLIGVITIPEVLIANQLRRHISTLFQRMTYFVSKSEQAYISYTRIQEQIKDNIINNDNQKITEIKQGDNVNTIALKLNNTSYSYNKEALVLNDITAQIPKGKFTAIVGQSGSGKSTLLKTILGICYPQQGEVIINGVTVTENNLTDIRKMLAYVPQNSFLFTRTVEENIKMGNLKASENAVKEAATAAEAHSFILQLNDEYNTIIGDKGIELSGGQKQRIALARAFIRNASIVLLDEPTAALDNLTADTLFKVGLKRQLLNGTTVVIATHDIDLALKADYVITLSNGNLMEQGTPTELLENDGIFKGLYRQKVKSKAV